MAASLLFSCTIVERDNHCDLNGKNYKGCPPAVVPLGCRNAGISYSCSMKGYKTVKINGKVWMAENLNCDVEGSHCYDNETENCNTYGRLYDWCTAMAVCPRGWHLPSNEEWQKLVDFAGGEWNAGKYLKAKDGWIESNGEDKYGFSALPGGREENDTFIAIGNFGLWWSSTEYEFGTYNAYEWVISFLNDGVEESGGTDKEWLQSVRCIKD